MHISTKCSVAIHCLIFILEYGDTQKVTSVKFGTGGTSLNCPPNEITLYRICKAIEPDFASKLIGLHPFPSPLCPIGKNIHDVLDCSYQKISNDLCESLKSITLENVISDYHHIQFHRD